MVPLVVPPNILVSKQLKQCRLDCSLCFYGSCMVLYIAVQRDYIISRTWFRLPGSPAFQCASLKNWEWPWYEAMVHQLYTLVDLWTRIITIIHPIYYLLNCWSKLVDFSLSPELDVLITNSIALTTHTHLLPAEFCTKSKMALGDHKSKQTQEAFLRYVTSKYTLSVFDDQQVWSWDHQLALSGDWDKLKNDRSICPRQLLCGQQSVFQTYGVVCAHLS